MEFDELKSLWNTIEPLPKTAEEVRDMLKENNHPVLRKIRKQFTIEIVGWVALLACYYTMFDGDRRPAAFNIILIISVIAPLMHNLYGYNFARYLADEPTIKKSLEEYLRRIKVYMMVSIVSRIIFLCGLMLFFSSAVTFDARKYLVLAALTLVLVLFQTIFLYRIWTKRITAIRATLTGLS